MHVILLDDKRVGSGESVRFLMPESWVHGMQGWIADPGVHDRPHEPATVRGIALVEPGDWRARTD